MTDQNGTPPGDHDDARRLRLAALVAEEAEHVLRLLPVVQTVQWDRGVAKVLNESGRRVEGGHSDPTADVATDPGRLYLRDVLTRSTPHLAQAVTSIGGVRRGLERALSSWQGDDPTSNELDSEPCPPSTS